jgi:hypothetical protein
MRLNSRYWDQIMAAHGAEHKAAQERIEELREQLEKARQENPRLAEFVPDGDYWERIERGEEWRSRRNWAGISKPAAAGSGA